MAKRRKRIGLSGSVAEHHSASSDLLNNAQKWLNRAGAARTCAQIQISLQNAAEEMARAEENGRWGKRGPEGKQRKRLKDTEYSIRRKINAAFSKFTKVCTRQLPDFS